MERQTNKTVVGSKPVRKTRGKQIPRKQDMDKITEVVWVLTLSLAERYKFNHVIVCSEMQYVGNDGNYYFFRDARTNSPVFVSVKACKAVLYRDGQTWSDDLMRFYQLSTEQYKALLAEWQAEDEEMQTAALEQMDSTGAVCH